MTHTWTWSVVVWLPWRRRVFGTFGRRIWCWRVILWARDRNGLRSRMYLTGSASALRRYLAELDGGES